MKISSETCQIKNVIKGVGQKSQKPYEILVLQEKGGNELSINCNGVSGLDALPELENCSFEAVVKSNRFGLSFDPSHPPVFKFHNSPSK